MATPGLPQQALHTLYNDHHLWLRSWLQRRLRSSSDAADLTHDTYERLIRSNKQPGSHESRSWLVQIARGLVIDLHRRRRLELAYLEALAASSDRETVPAEAREIALETLMEIDAVLDKLSPKARQAFLLSRFDNLTYAQIAERLNVSVASIHKYMLNAIKICYAAAYPGHGPTN